MGWGGVMELLTYLRPVGGLGGEWGGVMGLLTYLRPVGGLGGEWGGVGGGCFISVQTPSV